MSEPKTPSEKAEHELAQAILDAFLASQDIRKLSLDPVALPSLLKEEAELWRIKLQIDEVISFIRMKNGDNPLPNYGLRMVRRV